MDELVKIDPNHRDHSSKPSPTNLTITALRSITAACDSLRTVYPCVSFYGCLDLDTFGTCSNRPINLQLLQPVFPFVDEVRPDQLPSILRVFADKSLRKLMHEAGMRQREQQQQQHQQEDEQMTDYDKAQEMLTHYLLNTGGVPRRSSRLLASLHKFDKSTDAPEIPKTPSSAKDYLEKAVRWLQNAEPWIDSALGEADCRVRGIDQADIDTADLEKFAVDTSMAYELFDNSHANHIQSLRGSVDSYCQLLPFTHPKSKEERVLTFVPLPVLKETKVDHSITIGPVFSTLLDLGSSLDQYSKVEFQKGSHTQPGKLLERVMKDTVMLFARSNKTFTLSDLCGRTGGLFDVALRGGPGVADLNDDRKSKYAMSFEKTLSAKYFPLDPSRQKKDPFMLPYKKPLLNLLKTKACPAWACSRLTRRTWVATSTSSFDAYPVTVGCWSSSNAATTSALSTRLRTKKARPIC